VCLLVIAKAGKEDTEDPIRISEIIKVEFVFRQRDLQIDINNCICTAETEDMVMFSYCLNGIEAK